jgi:signal transduction histidine kinase
MASDFGERIRILEHLGEIPLVECNAPQVNQVFRNLLLNAVQVIEGEGDISVSTRASGTWVDIEIADTGHGIAPENLDRVFEPFFTTRSVGRGSGLGLSVAYHVVKRHGGSISVESEPGKGARFTVSLPLVPNAAVDPEKP